MTQQLDLFAPPPLAPGQQTEHDRRRAEAAEGERLKREGMRLAAMKEPDLLGQAREIAFDIQRGMLAHADGAIAANGLCNADDVAYQWQRMNEGNKAKGLPQLDWIGNAAGHLFQGGNWECVGMVKSARPHAHRNLLRQWKWKHSNS